MHHDAETEHIRFVAVGFASVYFWCQVQKRASASNGLRPYVIQCPRCAEISNSHHWIFVENAKVSAVYISMNNFLAMHIFEPHFCFFQIFDFLGPVQVFLLSILIHEVSLASLHDQQP